MNVLFHLTYRVECQCALKIPEKQNSRRNWIKVNEMSQQINLPVKECISQYDYYVVRNNIGVNIVRKE